MRRGQEPTPWGIWALGWMIAIVFTGGVVDLVTDTDSPVRIFHDPVVVETTIHDVHVLPEQQLKLDGTLTRLAGGDVVGPPLRTPLQFPGGGATIEDALVDGQRSTIVWDGGRPFMLEGSGGIDLGPVRMSVEHDGSSTWAVSDGVRSMLKGSYQLRTPVAVGHNGLASPRDAVTFTADDETTIETAGVAATTSPAPALHLEGPGTLILDGSFTMRTRDGTRKVTHLEFGPGPFRVDVTTRPDGVHLVATLQGEVRNVK